MKKFNKLLEKEILNNEEMEELLGMVDCYKEYEDCGRSGKNPEFTWYNIILNDDTEVSVYCNHK